MSLAGSRKASLAHGNGAAPGRVIGHMRRPFRFPPGQRPVALLRILRAALSPAIALFNPGTQGIFLILIPTDPLRQRPQRQHQLGARALPCDSGVGGGQSRHPPAGGQQEASRQSNIFLMGRSCFVVGHSRWIDHSRGLLDWPSYCLLALWSQYGSLPAPAGRLSLPRANFR